MTDGQVLVGAQYMVPAFSGAHSPADATTYYLSQWPGAPSASEGLGAYFPREGQIRRIWLQALVAGTLGSAEVGSLYIRVNNAVDYLISSALKWDAALQVVSVEYDPGAGPAVTLGDYWELKLVTPTWVTNPTTVLYSGGLWVENQ